MTMKKKIHLLGLCAGLAAVLSLMFWLWSIWLFHQPLV